MLFEHCGSRPICAGRREERTRENVIASYGPFNAHIEFAAERPEVDWFGTRAQRGFALPEDQRIGTHSNGILHVTSPLTSSRRIVNAAQIEPRHKAGRIRRSRTKLDKNTLMAAMSTPK
jgi:hypothetical protein